MKIEVLLNTGSTIDEGRLAKGGNKLTPDYTDECAVCVISSDDFDALDCPRKVKVISIDGEHEVAVYAKCDDSVRAGEVFMPRAIWSNMVISPETFSTGSPLYKGSPVVVEPTDEDVLAADEIVQNVYMGGR